MSEAMKAKRDAEERAIEAQVAKEQAERAKEQAEREKEIYRLHYAQGMGIKEIASVLGITKEEVGKLIQAR